MTRPKFKIKKGDMVKVMTGKHKGQVAKIEKVLVDEAKVLVEGVNMVTRFAKPSQLHPEGPFQIHKPIHISNVALVNGDNQHSKVGFKMEADQKVRIFKKTGEKV